MRSRAREPIHAGELESTRSALTLSGALLVAGFLLNAVVTMAFHPSGNEDDHEAIFAEYADSGPWVAVHLGQFVGVLLILAGLLMLYRPLRGDAPYLALLGAGAAIGTAATWAVLQAVDGVALKQAVDAWVDASGSEKAVRFADAETVRWTEWGVQSYVRVLFGATLLLFGVAIVVSRLIADWLGWAAVGAGVLSVAIGVDVGYSGLESDFQGIAVVAFQLVALTFVVGMFVTARRAPDRLAAAQHE